MKILNRLLMTALASTVLLGQAPAKQEDTILYTPRKPLYGRTHIGNPVYDFKAAELMKKLTLPIGVIERFIKVVESNELFFYGGKGYPYHGALLHASNREGKMAIGGFDLDIIHPGIADTQFVDYDWDGIPNSFSCITYPAWRYTAYKKFDELSKPEQFDVTQRFQHLVSYIADSTDGIKKDSVRIK